MIGSSCLIAVLGIDGSGKSTVSHRLAESLATDQLVCLVSDELKLYEDGRPTIEPAPITERLRHSVHVMAKHATSLKAYKIPKLTDLFLRDRLARIMAKKYQPRTIVTDGSPLLNMIAWASLYKKRVLPAETCSGAIGVLTGAAIPPDEQDALYESFPELTVIKRAGLNKLTRPDLCLFLDVTAKEACRRIAQRQEATQVHETAESLDRLRSAYLEVCKAAETPWDTRVRILDANAGPDDVMAAAERAVEAYREQAH